MKRFACAASIFSVIFSVVFCTGCKPTEPNAAAPPVVTAPGVSQQMSPEAAKAADAAAHRDKQGD